MSLWSRLRRLVSPIPALDYGHDSWIHDFTDVLAGRGRPWLQGFLFTPVLVLLASDDRNHASAEYLQAEQQRAFERLTELVGRLRLAFVSTVGFGLLPQWVRGFRALYPQVEFELIEATGDVQLQAMKRGEIDAGFMLHSPGFAPAGLQHLEERTQEAARLTPAAR